MKEACLPVETPTIYGPRIVMALEDKNLCLALADRIASLAAVTASSQVAHEQPQLRHVFLAIEDTAQKLAKTLYEKANQMQD
jgi:hypothetical protein